MTNGRPRAVLGLLRGVNVGGRKALRMEALRQACAAIGLPGARTLLQSGTVVFGTTRTDRAALSEEIRTSVRASTGVDVPVMLRTKDELEAHVAACPWPPASGREPALLLALFFSAQPSARAWRALLTAHSGPEEIALASRDAWAYYPAGIGRSKLTVERIERALGVAATGRNWNTVAAALDLCRDLEAGSISAG